MYDCKHCTAQNSGNVKTFSKWYLHLSKHFQISTCTFSGDHLKHVQNFENQSVKIGNLELRREHEKRSR